MLQEFNEVILASSVKSDKLDTIKDNLGTMLEKFEEWDKLNDSIVVKTRDDVPQTKLAKQARITIKNARRAGEDYFDSKRKEVQELKAEYDAEDKLYLKLKQTFSTLCKQREALLEEKENYIDKLVEIETKERNEQRFKRMLEYTNTPQIYNYETLDDNSFELLLEQLQREKAAILQLEKEAAEKEKRTNEMKSKLLLLAQYIPNFYDLNFSELSDEQFETVYKDAVANKDAEIKRQQEKDRELELLRAEKLKQELAQQRLSELQNMKYGAELLKESINLASIMALDEEKYAELYQTVDKLNKDELRRLESEKQEQERIQELVNKRKALTQHLVKYIPNYFTHDWAKLNDFEFAEIIRNAEDAQLEEKAKEEELQRLKDMETKMQAIKAMPEQAEEPIINLTEKEFLTNALNNLSLPTYDKELSEKGLKIFTIFVNTLKQVKEKGFKLIGENYANES